MINANISVEWEVYKRIDSSGFYSNPKWIVSPARKILPGGGGACTSADFDL
jgi:hypothetical protein